MISFGNEIYPFMKLWKAEYEKANIWPEYKSNKQASEILFEEIEEMLEKVDELVEMVVVGEDKILEVDTGYVIGQTVSIIAEALQIIAVCNKGAEIFDGGNVRTISEVTERNCNS